MMSIQGQKVLPTYMSSLESELQMTNGQNARVDQSHSLNGAVYIQESGTGTSNVQSGKLDANSIVRQIRYDQKQIQMNQNNMKIKTLTGSRNDPNNMLIN